MQVAFVLNRTASGARSPELADHLTRAAAVLICRPRHPCSPRRSQVIAGATCGISRRGRCSAHCLHAVFLGLSVLAAIGGAGWAVLGGERSFRPFLLTLAAAPLAALAFAGWFARGGGPDPLAVLAAIACAIALVRLTAARLAARAGARRLHDADVLNAPT